MLRSEGGFSLVELLAAVLFLLIGMGGVITMLNTANRVTTTNNARIGATNLTRELMEQVRTMPYGELTPAGIQAELIDRGYGAVSGGEWKYTYRKIEYTIDAQACVYDDPVDGIASVAPEGGTPCATATATTPADADGDDFRRVTFTFTSTDDGDVRTTKQAELVVNPSGGLGPRIKSFTGPNPITGGASAEYKIETFTNASTVKWTSDDGFSQGSATGEKTLWSFFWKLQVAPDPANPYPIPQGTVLDGTYQLVAQAVNDRGIPGEAKVFVVTVERSAPFIPRDLFRGGHVTRDGHIVDLRWAPNFERDIKGYKVIRSTDADYSTTADNVQVCPATAGDNLLASQLSCQDTAPLSDVATYFLVALDQDQDSAPRALTIPAPGAQPDPPASLSAQTSTDGTAVRLNWTAPASGNPAFYRIYRDGTTYDHRYAEVSGDVVSWRDPEPGFTHEYYLVAVDSSFNESPTVGPVAVGGTS